MHSATNAAESVDFEWVPWFIVTAAAAAKVIAESPSRSPSVAVNAATLTVQRPQVAAAQGEQRSVEIHFPFETERNNFYSPENPGFVWSCEFGEGQKPAMWIPYYE